MIQQVGYVILMYKGGRMEMKKSIGCSDFHMHVINSLVISTYMGLIHLVISTCTINSLVISTGMWLIHWWLKYPGMHVVSSFWVHARLFFTRYLAFTQLALPRLMAVNAGTKLQFVITSTLMCVKLFLLSLLATPSVMFQKKTLWDRENTRLVDGNDYFCKACYVLLNLVLNGIVFVNCLHFTRYSFAFTSWCMHFCVSHVYTLCS